MARFSIICLGPPCSFHGLCACLLLRKFGSLYEICWRLRADVSNEFSFCKAFLRRPAPPQPCARFSGRPDLAAVASAAVAASSQQQTQTDENQVFKFQVLCVKVTLPLDYILLSDHYVISRCKSRCTVLGLASRRELLAAPAGGLAVDATRGLRAPWPPGGAAAAAAGRALRHRLRMQQRGAAKPRRGAH